MISMKGMVMDWDMQAHVDRAWARLEAERSKATKWDKVRCAFGWHRWTSSMAATSGRYAYSCKRCRAEKGRVVWV
jgi:hypothetical protein